MDRQQSKLVLVTVPNWLLTHIDNQTGQLGASKSEIIRNICIAYLTNNGIIKPNGENNGTSRT